MSANDQALIEAAIAGGLIDSSVVSPLKDRARRERVPVLNLLTQTARIPLSGFYRALAEQRGLAFLTQSEIKPDPELCQRLPASLLDRKGVLVARLADGRLGVLTSNPDDLATLKRVERIVGGATQTCLAEPSVINSQLRSISSNRRGAGLGVDASSEGELDPIVELDELFMESWLLRASDIHIEPRPDRPRLRLRVDGQLQLYTRELSTAQVTGIISRVKVLAELDIAEQREAQDGGLTYTLPPPSSEELDLRIATVPTRWGERMTIRILGQETDDLTLGAIGMDETTRAQMSQAIREPFGLILLTGPTGSGKTTTLYAAIREIIRPEINIMTVEDPIEYLMPDVAQVQVSGKVSFASALRSFLRHDPDVLMVGEIRDHETADIALKAAMTGHLVFSTLHTNDSPSAITRLIDIGTERFLLASSLLGVVAQRLARRLCQNCAKETIPSDDEKAWLAISDPHATAKVPIGCPKCLGTGYKGRIGLYEALWVDEAVSDAIYQGALEHDIAKVAPNLITLYQDARSKVLEGITSIEEVKRLVRPPAV